MTYEMKQTENKALLKSIKLDNENNRSHNKYNMTSIPSI